MNEHQNKMYNILIKEVLAVSLPESCFGTVSRWANEETQDSSNEMPIACFSFTNKKEMWTMLPYLLLSIKDETLSAEYLFRLTYDFVGNKIYVSGTYCPAEGQLDWLDEDSIEFSVIDETEEEINYQVAKNFLKPHNKFCDAVTKLISDAKFKISDVGSDWVGVTSTDPVALLYYCEAIQRLMISSGKQGDIEISIAANFNILDEKHNDGFLKVCAIIPWGENIPE